MTTEVMIAGAGPTGLTLAVEVSRRGIPVRIVDKASAFSAGSRGDGLQPRTLEVFEDLGVLEEVFSSGIGAPLTRVYSADQVAWEGRMAEPVQPRPDVPYPNAWFVPQWRTEEILRSRLSSYGIEVELGTGVVDFEQDADGVTVRLDGGETVRSSFLIGADGGRSTVRKRLGVPFVGETNEEIRMLLADVRVDGLGHDNGHGWMLDDGTFFGFTPLAGSSDGFVIATTAATEMEPTLDDLQRTVEAVSGRRDIRLLELMWATVWRPNVRMAERFRDRRVLLAGDAAHVHPPTGGQGLNTGVQDAYNLGWKLAAVLGGAPDSLLDSYESERIPVAAHVLGISSELLEKHVSGAADAMERGETFHQLDLSYRSGPLALDDDSSATLAAGDRAPDAPILRDDGQRRLFDLYAGTHWTLLRFGPQAPRIDHPAVWSHDVGTEIIDADNHVQDAYRAKPDTAILVRPDGYIGAITSATAGLSAYAGRVLTSCPAQSSPTSTRSASDPMQ
jgi:2-polyprenyl-6-methoxyphenol hydroxylase-like FAD-dependent oxidoreductase